jgi:hypothetical protein
MAAIDAERNMVHNRMMLPKYEVSPEIMYPTAWTMTGGTRTLCSDSQT